MTEALNGVLTAENYPGSNSVAGGCQLGPVANGLQLDLVVGNAPALVRLYTLDNPALGIGGGGNLTDEFVLVAGNGQISQNSYRNCIGFQARDFVAGTHATVYATVWERGDPTPLGGTNYGGTLTAQGSTSVSTGLSLIQTIGPLTSPAPSFDFQGIPATFTHLLIEMFARGSIAATTENSTFQMNGDTGANYDAMLMGADGAGGGGGGPFINQNSALWGTTPAANGTANIFGGSTLKIYNYLNTFAYKHANGQSGDLGAESAGNTTTRTSAGLWKSTAAINRVTILPAGGGNYVNGSQAWLYGIS